MKTIIVVLFATIAVACAESSINMLCTHDDQCTDSTANTFCRIYEGCTVGKCRCNDAAGYSQDGDDCKKLKKIEESCNSSNNKCGNGTCTSGTCSCEDDEHPSSDNTECLVNGLEDSCTSNSHCQRLPSASGNPVEGDCTNDKCECPATHKTVSASHCELGNVDATCFEDSHCSLNMKCTSQKCKCKGNHKWNEGLYACVHNNAAVDRSVNNTCTVREVSQLAEFYSLTNIELCAAGVSCTQCYVLDPEGNVGDDLPVCIGGYVSFSRDKSSINNTCTKDSNCKDTTDAVCHIMEGCDTGICKCKKGFKDIGEVCFQVKKIGESCTSSSLCVKGGLCNADRKCECERHLEASSDKTKCVTRAPKASCSNNDMCKALRLPIDDMHGIAGTCTNDECVCPPAMKTTTTACEHYKKDEDCSGGKKCIPSLKCVDNKCACINDDDYEYDADSGHCFKKGATTNLTFGKDCTDTKPYGADLAEYLNLANGKYCKDILNCRKCMGCTTGCTAKCQGGPKPPDGNGGGPNGNEAIRYGLVTTLLALLSTMLHLL